MNLATKKKDLLKHIIIFSVLMITIFVLYFVMHKVITRKIEQRKYREEFNKEYTSSWEYVKTKDYASVIDKYGLEVPYLLEFDIKTTQPTEVNVNFQNGYGAKYAFEKSVESTTEYKHYSITITPTNWMSSETEACVAFSAPYNTGIIPTVTKIKFTPILNEDETIQVNSNE